MINARFNPIDRSVGLVYHRRKLGLDATVQYHRFLASTQAWDSAGPWPVSGNTTHDQWNGALDYDSSGNYLVTYYDYDRGTAPSYITYGLWATTLFPSGGWIRDDHLNPLTNSDPRNVYTYSGSFYLGEYQDVWNWFNGWNAATVAIQQSRGDIYVSVETP